MNPIAILLVGMAVVVGGVLLLRVHAFLALIVGALIVSFLTPRESVYEQELRAKAVPVVEAAESGGVFLVLRKENDDSFREVARVQFDPEEGDRGTARIVGSRDRFKIRDGDLIVRPDHQQSAASLSAQSIGQHVAVGFGRTCMGIGILIAMAAIIGKCLLDSGGAERVVLSIRRVMGEERTGVAFLGSGFLVGIPVFFDTVFYLLVPLAKAMHVKTGKHYVLYILAIVAGASIAHSLVPPTPGPLFVANELGVDIGLMILGGSIVGIFALPFGYAFAKWANRRWDIPLRPSSELSAEELEAMANRDESALPSLGLSLLPILLPVVLIAGNTILGMLVDESAPVWIAGFLSVIELIGNKNVALVIAGIVAITLLAKQLSNDRDLVKRAVGAALASGGVIILITAAGGSFGHVLRLTGISNELKELIPATQLILLPAAFLTTTLVRVAQGSATVAMITAVGIFAPIATMGDLSFHPLYLALAIGTGSKPYPWMNDSGFWIISTMSGFTEAETLKTASVVITLMGFAGLAATMVGSFLFPLV